MRHFFRTHLTPAEVMTRADAFFAALSLKTLASGARSRTWQGTVGTPEIAAKAKKGDFVFLQFSGHGSYQPASGDTAEQDGRDEIFLAADTKMADGGANLPNVVTDKLSAIAGLVVFPLVIAALVGIGLPARYYPRVVDACLVACGIAFVLIKLWEPATQAGEWVLRHMSPRSTGIDRDPTDLVALPMLLVSRWCDRTARRHEGEEPLARN